MTVDVLVTKYMMDNRDYIAGSNQVVGATGRVANAIGSYGIPIITAFTTAIIGASTAFAGLAIVSSQKAAEFDAMVKALESVVGSAENAKKALEELHAIAAMPGLGLEEALKGYTALRRTDMTDSMAMRTISAAGNANALASGGRAELEQILRAISQIAMKPNLSGEELMQLNEAGVPASKIIGDKFGTFDGAELKKLGVDSKQALEALVEGLEKMPKAMGSAKNSIENLGMALDMAMVGIGTSINNSMTPVIDNITSALENVTENGLFELFGEKLAEIAEATFPALAMSGGELEDQFIEIAAMAANVAEALSNAYMNIQDIVNLMSQYDPLKWLTGGKVDVRKSLGQAMGAGERVKSAGDNLKDEHYLGKDLREANKKRDKEKDAQSAPMVEPIVEIPKAENLLTKIHENTKQMADAMLASSVGGSLYGDSALSQASFSGAPGGSKVERGVSLIISGLMEAQTRAVRRR